MEKGDDGDVDDAEVAAVFFTSLREIITMRRGGVFDQEVFDRYNQNLVQLPDEMVAQILA